MRQILQRHLRFLFIGCFAATGPTAWPVTPCLGQAQPLSTVIVEPSSSGVEELPPASEAILDGLNQAIANANAANQKTSPGAEVVTERYPDGKVKIQREVVQDQDQNYVNHGKWKSYDRDGNVAMEGRFDMTQMNGVWTRIYRHRENKLLNIAPFNQAQLPIISQGNFRDGELHGKWVIYDALKRKLCEWEFTDGKRDGTSTWWFASGLKMREISYVEGTIEGTFNEWDRNGKQVTQDRYVEGSLIAKKTEHYAPNRKRAEGMVRYPKLVLEQADDWMDCKLATYSMDGEPVKYGKWTSWYANGQVKHEGVYRDDMPSGKFTWWHENGQRSLVAEYRDGKKHGSWVWWHPNGLKSIQGQYADDSPSSKWLWWETSGKVAQRVNFDDPNQRQVLAMPNDTLTRGARVEVPGGRR